jgi:hypothetical protein
MDQRNEDQAHPERESSRNDEQAGVHARETNETPSPHGGATAEGGALNRDAATPPKR